MDTKTKTKTMAMNMTWLPWPWAWPCPRPRPRPRYDHDMIMTWPRPRPRPRPWQAFPSFLCWFKAENHHHHLFCFACTPAMAMAMAMAIHCYHAQPPRQACTTCNPVDDATHICSSLRALSSSAPHLLPSRRTRAPPPTHNWVRICSLAVDMDVSAAFSFPLLLWRRICTCFLHF